MSASRGNMAAGLLVFREIRVVLQETQYQVWVHIERRRETDHTAQWYYRAFPRNMVLAEVWATHIQQAESWTPVPNAVTPA